MTSDQALGIIAKMKVINFFAEPSAGKSTTASGLFFGMKHLGLNVELVNEYAKMCVWEDKKRTLDDQLYVTAKQNHQIERLRGKVDFVITDSPLLLGIIYKRSSGFPSFEPLVKEVFDSYENFNVLLRRTKPYRTEGRMQTESAARIVATQVRDLLRRLEVPFIEEAGDLDAPRRIWYHMLSRGFVKNLPFPLDEMPSRS